MLFMRLDIAPGLLIAFGLASLLPGAVALFARLDRRRTVALAGMAQLGMVVFAIGVGAKQVAWLHMTLLALARSAVLQSHGDDMLAWLALALLPLYALYLLAEPTVAVAAWLLVPLAAGVLLACWALLERRPAGVATGWLAATPVWLQLALIVLLAFAMPARWSRGSARWPRMSAAMQPRRALTRDEWTRMAGEPSPPLLALWADTREVYALLRDGDRAAAGLDRGRGWRLSGPVARPSGRRVVRADGARSLGAYGDRRHRSRGLGSTMGAGRSARHWRCIPGRLDAPSRRSSCFPRISTSSRWVRFAAASSRRRICVLASAARPSCGWRRGWATRTRAR